MGTFTIESGGPNMQFSSVLKIEIIIKFNKIEHIDVNHLFTSISA